MKFGEKLTGLRKSRGMSQEELASQISVSRQAVSRWESGDTMPDAANIVQLGRLFEVTTDYLLYDEYGEEAGKEAQASETRQPADCTAGKRKEKNTGRLWLAVSAALSSAGALGLLVIWVLSTMIQSGFSSAASDGINVWYTNDLPYSFSGFVQMYRLNALVGIFCFCLTAGILLTVWKLISVRLSAGRGDKDGETAR